MPSTPRLKNSVLRVCEPNQSNMKCRGTNTKVAFLLSFLCRYLKGLQLRSQLGFMSPYLFCWNLYQAPMPATYVQTVSSERMWRKKLRSGSIKCGSRAFSATGLSDGLSVRGWPNSCPHEKLATNRPTVRVLFLWKLNLVDFHVEYWTEHLNLISAQDSYGKLSFDSISKTLCSGGRSRVQILTTNNVA